MRLSRPEAEALYRAAKIGWVAWQSGPLPPSSREERSASRALGKLRQEIANLGQADRLSEAQMELRAALHRLWMEAGEPSVRQMARDMGKSHMTWHNALRCEPMPSLSVFRKLVIYLDGDLTRLEPMFLEAKGKVPVSSFPGMVD